MSERIFSKVLTVYFPQISHMDERHMLSGFPSRARPHVLLAVISRILKHAGYVNVDTFTIALRGNLITTLHYAHTDADYKLNM